MLLTPFAVVTPYAESTLPSSRELGLQKFDLPASRHFFVAAKNTLKLKKREGHLG